MQEEIIKKLSISFAEAKTRNPAFSLRAFARKMKLQPSAVSEILNGKRVITRKMGKKILDSLCVSPVEVDNILSKKDKNNQQITLSLDYFKVISQWYYFAILSLAEIDDFKADARWISKRLNISLENAKQALEILLKLELLTLHEGKVVVNSLQYTTPTDIANVSLKNHTIQTLELAKDSVINDPVEIRDFSTVTMAINLSKIPHAKKMIKNFRKKIAKLLETGKKEEVYKLSIQLFPLTRNANYKEKK
ncbi:MAG: hypothetical protein A2202_01125 [Bdellovibrionales bacterium RIFOXYA1_FULL_36_14]|nr:MAG: hypothetical protein A2202_01125 [Bdellovibrionales bacterium RIFOXYA1_FULL_36_14]